jgi:hypothetical protein
VEGSVLCWRSAVHLWQGRWQDARRDAVAAQRVAERTKTLYVFAMGRALAAYADWVVERSAGSLQDLMTATSWLEVRDKGLFISLNYGWLAHALVASARFDEARRYAARALWRKRKRDRLGEPMTYRALANAAVVEGRTGDARRYLLLAMRGAEARSSPHEVAVNQLHQAELESAAGEPTQALALLDHATRAFEAMDMTWHLDRAAALRRSL